MAFKTDLLKIVLITIFWLLLGGSSLPCEDNRCKTGSCNSDGACICNLPHPSTILDGDRPFMGGRFCEEKMTMCDGSDWYWCENGGKCEEIVQGEKYRCKCEGGFGGEHCENRGKECGEIYCFNGGQCLFEDGICDCPTNWRGTSDCSLPTITPSASSSANKTTTLQYPLKSSVSPTWIVVAFAISCTAVAVCVSNRKKLFSKDDAGPKFQQLSQLQSRDILDADDYEDDVAMFHDDRSHL